MADVLLHLNGISGSELHWHLRGSSSACWMSWRKRQRVRWPWREEHLGLLPLNWKILFCFVFFFSFLSRLFSSVLNVCFYALNLHKITNWVFKLAKISLAQQHFVLLVLLWLESAPVFGPGDGEWMDVCQPADCVTACHCCQFYPRTDLADTFMPEEIYCNEPVDLVTPSVLYEQQCRGVFTALWLSVWLAKWRKQSLMKT